MKKQISSIFALFLLCAMLVTGCGRKQTPVEVSPTAVPDMTPDPHEGMVEVYDGYGGTMWVEAAEELQPFSMDRSQFSVSDDTVTYGGEGYTLRTGVDVSEHQGEIDWEAVAASGIDFAILRCGWRGFSEGMLYEDEYFRRNIEGAQAAGLNVGVYFFSQAVSLAEGAEEALLVLDILEGYELQLPVYFDWEKIDTSPARTDDVPGSVVTDACLEFCEILASEGYDVGVYTYLNLAYYTYELDRLKDLPFWLGDPGSFPEFYYDHGIWQYTFSGSVPGIEGDVDMNVMYISTQPVVEIVSVGEAQG